ncbi:MAG TPA: PorP/SprF family type IX secretion system membrane protein [Sediminibacterium sp.]|nr:PorP/SprF family type IX secretion system membrane protein [Sediminibacterium sp.]
MKKRLLYILLGILPILGLHAQDPHFSQYFSSPLTFNPAFTGFFNAGQRLSINYRNQWANLGDPYTTGTASYDWRILKNAIAPNDKWGVGILGLYDQSSGGVYKNAYLGISTAFNKGLDEDGDQSIGIGVQAVLARNSVDFNKISFSTQFSGSGFDLSIPSGESVRNRTINYVDLNAGLLYNFQDDADRQFSFGASVFHLLQPRLSYFSGSNPNLPARYTVHAGASLPAGDKDQVFFSAHAMQQADASEYVAGAAYGIGVGNTDLTAYLGAWIRINDAWYPYIGLRSPDYQFGISYDLTKSDIQQVQRYSSSLEISFQYFFNGEGKKRGIPCFF